MTKSNCRTLIQSLFLKLVFLSLALTLSACGFNFNTNLESTLPPLETDLEIEVFDSGNSSSLTTVEVDEGSTLVFLVTQNKVRNKGTDIEISIQGDSGAIASSFSTSFPISKNITTGDTSSTVSLTINNITGYSGQRSFEIQLSVPGTSTEASFTLKINDLDPTPVVELTASTQSIAENAGIGLATVTLSQAANADISVEYSFIDNTAVNSSHYTGNNGTLVFSAGQTSKDISFNITDDGGLNADRDFSITLSHLSGLLATLGSNTTQTVTLTDDEIPLGAFNIDGVTSSGDTIEDAFLSNSLSPIVTWEASTSATSYDITVFENGGSSVACATQTTASTTFDFSGAGCTLTAGNNYKVQVTATDGVDSLDAANGLYSFYVNQSPTLGTDGEGAWYVMAGSSIDIDAQWAASPAVGVATDPEGDTLTFSLVSSASLGSTDISAGSSLTYTAGSENGRDSLSYILLDDKGGKLTGTLVIHVVKANTWTGAVDTDWTNAGNWCGAIAADSKGCSAASAKPGSADVVYFDDTCESAFTCTPTTSVNETVEGVNIKANGFNQGTGVTLTVDALGWTQTGGSFSGSDLSINMNGPLTISGGSFTSTTATLQISKNWTTTGSPTFDPNGGKVSFTGIALQITSGNIEFNNVEIKGPRTINGSMKVLGALEVNSSSGNVTDGGIIEAHGDVLMTKWYYGNATLKMVGTGNQTLYGGASRGYALPNFEIAKPSGILYLDGFIGVSGDFTYTSGTINTLTSEVSFTQNNGSTISSGAMNFNNVAFLGSRTIDGEMKVFGDMEFNSGAGNTLTGGTISARGDVLITKLYAGTTLMKFVGTNAQTITGASSTYNLPYVEVDKSGGSLSFSGTVGILRDYTHTNGTVSGAAGSTVYFNGTDQNISPGSSTFVNVAITKRVDISGVLNVTGNLDVVSNASPTLNSGTIEVAGDVYYQGYSLGNGTIRLVGTNAQSIASGGASYLAVPYFEVNKAGGTVTLSDNFYVKNNSTITSGSMDLSTYNFDTTNLLTIEAAGSIDRTNGSLTYGSVVNNGSVTPAL